MSIYTTSLFEKVILYCIYFFVIEFEQLDFKKVGVHFVSRTVIVVIFCISLMYILYLEL